MLTRALIGPGVSVILRFPACVAADGLQSVGSPRADHQTLSPRSSTPSFVSPRMTKFLDVAQHEALGGLPATSAKADELDICGEFALSTANISLPYVQKANPVAVAASVF